MTRLFNIDIILLLKHRDKLTKGVMKIQDCYIWQKVGFNYQEEVFVGVIKSLDGSVATICSNEHEDSELGKV